MLYYVCLVARPLLALENIAFLQHSMSSNNPKQDRYKNSPKGMVAFSRLLRTYGYNPGRYGGEEGMHGNALLPLDRISPATAGRVAKNILLQGAKGSDHLVVVRALAIISSRQGMEEIILQDRWQELRQMKRPARWTNAKYADHFKDLEVATLIKRTEMKFVEFFSTYFSVPKNEEVARSIFNGKLLSTYFQRPPPVNILDAPRLIEMIEAWCKDFGGDIYMINGDFRHWFHQLSMEEANHRWFGLLLAGEDQPYVWTALPMGWSWSPYIAQAIGLGVLAYRPFINGVLGPLLVDDRGLSDDQLPNFFTPPQ